MFVTAFIAWPAAAQYLPRYQRQCLHAKLITAFLLITPVDSVRFGFRLREDHTEKKSVDADLRERVAALLFGGPLIMWCSYSIRQKWIYTSQKRIYASYFVCASQLRSVFNYHTQTRWESPGNSRFCSVFFCIIISPFVFPAYQYPLLMQSKFKCFFFPFVK